MITASYMITAEGAKGVRTVTRVPEPARHAVDRLHGVSTTSPVRLPARDLALIAVFAALIAALGLVPVLQPFGTIAPITAQTLGVMLAGSILGARRGALAVITFLAVSYTHLTLPTKRIV